MKKKLIPNPKPESMSQAKDSAKMTMMNKAMGKDVKMAGKSIAGKAPSKPKMRGR
jgi:hypothetical protein